LTTSETKILSYPGETIEFKDIFQTTENIIKILKEKDVDVIIAMTHLSLNDDLSLAKNFDDINIILGGHERII
jgi:5'-nucleotidase/UDP-sugar diphosphatase